MLKKTYLVFIVIVLLCSCTNSIQPDQKNDPSSTNEYGKVILNLPQLSQARAISNTDAQALTNAYQVIIYNPLVDAGSQNYIKKLITSTVSDLSFSLLPGSYSVVVLAIHQVSGNPSSYYLVGSGDAKSVVVKSNQTTNTSITLNSAKFDFEVTPSTKTYTEGDNISLNISLSGSSGSGSVIVPSWGFMISDTYDKSIITGSYSSWASNVSPTFSSDGSFSGSSTSLLEMSSGKYYIGTCSVSLYMPGTGGSPNKIRISEGNFFINLEIYWYSVDQIPSKTFQIVSGVPPSPGSVGIDVTWG